MNVYRAIRLFTEAAAMISLVAMVLVVCLQVFARFALPSAPAWTEELSRVFFVYSVAFGVGVAVDRQELVRLSLLESRLSERANAVLQTFIQGTVIAVSLLIAVKSFTFVGIGESEYSPVLGIRMSLVFASATVTMIVAAGFSTYLLFDQRKSSSP